MDTEHFFLFFNSLIKYVDSLLTRYQTTIFSSSDPWISQQCRPNSSTLNTKLRWNSSPTAGSSSQTVSSITFPPATRRNADGDLRLSSRSDSKQWAFRKLHQLQTRRAETVENNQRSALAGCNVSNSMVPIIST